MRDEILTYLEMCQRESCSLQKGMNYREPPGISIMLMSRRRGAPYDDEMSEDGTELIYEGHDAARSPDVANPKGLDQPWMLPSGAPTDNAKFARASGQGAVVRVYEKLRDGIWSDKGLFDLIAFEYMESGGRRVFKFHLRLAADQRGPVQSLTAIAADRPMTRMIPGWVKQAVYKRDKGQCVICGARDQLHFDHDLPFSRGGTGLRPENVRILCARHNLEKGARIE